MKLSRRFAALGIVAFCLLFMAMWVLLALLGTQRAVNRYKAQLRAAGEKLTINELTPPAPLPESNSAALVQGLSMNLNSRNESLLNRDPPAAMRMLSPGTAVVAWAQPYPGEHQTNTWDDLEAALAKEQEILQGLRQIIDCPYFDFQLDFKQGFGLLLPHLAPMKRAGQALSASAILNLHKGDSAAAAKDVRAAVALVKGFADERLPISQLVRIAVAHIAFAATWQLLQSTNVPDAQLTALQKDWVDLDFAKPAENALAMERAITERTLERMRNSSTEFRQIVVGGSPLSTSASSNPGDFFKEVGAAVREIRWRISWSYADELTTLEVQQILIDAMRRAGAERKFLPALRQQDERIAQFTFPATDEVTLRMNEPDLRHLFSQSVVSLRNTLKRVLKAEVFRQLAVTAIALNRHRSRHGSYPADLSTLVPEFLPAAPLDPVDGQPLRYRLNPDGSFLLYSIGEDGIDDGGDPKSAPPSKSHVWSEGRDLVWPQPGAEERDRKTEGRWGKEGF
jgi:hypothetical protein